MDEYLEKVINPGDRASKLAKEICFRSHGNNRAVRVVAHQPGNFRGPVGFVWATHILTEMRNGLREDPWGEVTDWTFVEEVENDGAGGKPQFLTLVGIPEVFHDHGWEIISMTADDFARSGRLPVLIDNEFNVQRITEKKFHLFQAAMEGYGEALQTARLVNITGETAIMRHSITAFCDAKSDEQLVFTWGASCIGLAHRKLMIDNSRITPGMAVVGFWEPGYRCNGGTYFTNLIIEKWGPDVRDILNNQEARKFAGELTTPSTSYAAALTSLIGWREDGSITTPKAKLYGVAHITGGGVWGKFKEILPQGVGANLYSMPQPAPVLLKGFEMGQGTSIALTPWQCYGTLHGGCGMLVVCEHADVNMVITHAALYGIASQVVGETIKSAVSEVLIESRFGKAKELSSEHPE